MDDPVTSALRRGLISQRQAVMLEPAEPRDRREGQPLGGRYQTKPVVQPADQPSLDQRMRAASVPATGSQIEDQGPDPRGWFHKLAGFFLGDDLASEAAAEWRGERRRENRKYAMMPLQAPLPNAKPSDPGYALGINDIPRSLGLSKVEQAQFDQGETPGSLPFEINNARQLDTDPYGGIARRHAREAGQ